MGAVFSKPLLATTGIVSMVVGQQYPECMCQVKNATEWCAKRDSGGLDNDCDGVDDDCDGIHDGIYRQLMGHDKARPGTLTWMDEDGENQTTMYAILMEYENNGTLPYCPAGSFPDEKDNTMPCQAVLRCRRTRRDAIFDNFDAQFLNKGRGKGGGKGRRNSCVQVEQRCARQGGKLDEDGVCRGKVWVARTGRNPQTGKEIKIAAKNVVRFKAGSDLSCKVR